MRHRIKKIGQSTLQMTSSSIIDFDTDETPSPSKNYMINRQIFTSIDLSELFNDQRELPATWKYPSPSGLRNPSVNSLKTKSPR